MKAWNFKVKNNHEKIIKELKSTLGSVGGFVFNMGQGKNDAILFNFRKRVIYPDQIILRNRIVVKGKLLKTDAENETDVVISFSQHFLISWGPAVYIGMGLFAIILGIISGTSAYILGGMFIAFGIAYWIYIQKKFEKDIQKYKVLISEILTF